MLLPRRWRSTASAIYSDIPNSAITRAYINRSLGSRTAFDQKSLSNILTDLIAPSGSGAYIMAMSTDSTLAMRDRWPRWLITHTTLYDLIAAINAEVGAEEDALVIACVLHLLNAQRLAWGGASVPGRMTVKHRLTPLRSRKASTPRHRRKSPFNALTSPSSRSDAAAHRGHLSAVGGRPRASDAAGGKSRWSAPVISGHSETGQMGHHGERFSVETCRKNT
jgi:hypothetical protein